MTDYTDQYFDNWNPNLSETYVSDYVYDNLSCSTVAALYEKEQTCFTKNVENNTLLLDIGSIKYAASLKEKKDVKRIFLNESNKETNSYEDVNFVYNKIPEISSLLQCQTSGVSLNISNCSTISGTGESYLNSNIVLLNNNKNDEWQENSLCCTKILHGFCTQDSLEYNSLILTKLNSNYQSYSINQHNDSLNKNEQTSANSINSLNLIKSQEKRSSLTILEHNKNIETSSNIYNNSNDLMKEELETYQTNIKPIINPNIQSKILSNKKYTGKIFRNKKSTKLTSINSKCDLKRQKENLILLENYNKSFSKFPKKRLCFTKDQTLRLKFFLFSNILVS